MDSPKRYFRMNEAILTKFQVHTHGINLYRPEARNAHFSKCKKRVAAVLYLQKCNSFQISLNFNSIHLVRNNMDALGQKCNF